MIMLVLVVLEMVEMVLGMCLLTFLFGGENMSEGLRRNSVLWLGKVLILFVRNLFMVLRNFVLLL